MKVKRLKIYENVEFNVDEIISGMSRLKGARRKPTSIALEEEVIVELKVQAKKMSLPYQVFMRLLLIDGLKRIKNN